MKHGCIINENAKVSLGVTTKKRIKHTIVMLKVHGEVWAEGQAVKADRILPG